MDEIRKLLSENVVLPLERAGQILGLKRNMTYAAAKAGDIKALRFGRLLKVPTAWLRAKLDLDGGAS
jgi:hypothetical protein